MMTTIYEGKQPPPLLDPHLSAFQLQPYIYMPWGQGRQYLVAMSDNTLFKWDIRFLDPCEILGLFSVIPGTKNHKYDEKL